MAKAAAEHLPPEQSGRAAKRLAIYERRKLIAANLLSGKTEEEVATDLDCTVAAVKKDILAVRKLWEMDAVANIKSHKALDLRRLEESVAAIWEAVRTGDLPSIQTLIKLLDRKAKLMGEDAAQKVEQETTVRFLVRAPEKLSMEDWDKMTTVVDAEVLSEERGDLSRPALPAPEVEPCSTPPSEGGGE